MKLPPHLHAVSRLRMGEAIPLLLLYPLWRKQEIPCFTSSKISKLTRQRKRKRHCLYVVFCRTCIMPVEGTLATCLFLKKYVKQSVRQVTNSRSGIFLISCFISRKCVNFILHVFSNSKNEHVMQLTRQ